MRYLSGAQMAKTTDQFGLVKRIGGHLHSPDNHHVPQIVPHFVSSSNCFGRRASVVSIVEAVCAERLGEDKDSLLVVIIIGGVGLRSRARLGRGRGDGAAGGINGVAARRIGNKEAWLQCASALMAGKLREHSGS